MIVVVDSGVANLRSVANSLRYLGAEMRIAHTPEEIAGASKIILPGVGAFSAGITKLREGGFIEPLRDYARRGMPFLGICLGMQLLFERSYEMGDFEGLGLLPGEIIKFPDGGPKIPHIGWNQLHFDGSSQLLCGVSSGAYAYFVHSYYARLGRPGDLIAYCDYGVDFPAVVGHDNVFGAQFHPEKSQHTGLTLLKNFMAL